MYFTKQENEDRSSHYLRTDESPSKKVTPRGS